MNDIKKSAVGAATPATETEKENFYTDIIPSDGEKIKMLSVEYLEHHPDNPRCIICSIFGGLDLLRTRKRSSRRCLTAQANCM